MPISAKDTKILWANAAGRCAFSDCREKLCTDKASGLTPHTVGEMAHIKGERKGSNRYDDTQDTNERNSYINLILLCPNHHTRIDRPENETAYSVATLHKMKERHEVFVSGRLDSPSFGGKNEVAAQLYPFIQENHEVFLAYGPQSEIARKNPTSEAHAVWQLERMATIVPNNRRMIGLIEPNKKMFSSDEHKILATFAVHVRSYERWVYDEVSYEGVVRFPVEFSELIEALSIASK